jgi:hypothetical protein
MLINIGKGMSPIKNALASVALPYKFYISEETNILAVSPYELTIADDNFFNPDEGIMAIIYEAPATAVNYTYLFVASNGSSANDTIGIREDSSAAIRGFVRDDGASLHSAANNDQIVRNTACLALLKYSNTGSTILSGQSTNEQSHAPLGDDLLKINVGSRNNGGDAKDLTVYKFMVINEDRDIPYALEKMLDHTHFIIAGGGQSLMRGHWSSQESGSSEGELKHRQVLGAAAPGKVAVMIDAGDGGTSILETSNSTIPNSEYWWDYDNDQPGPVLTNFYSTIADTFYKPTMVLWGQGEQDGHYIDNGTPAEIYEESLLKVFQHMRNTFGDIPIYIQPIGRRSGSYTNIGGVQAIREVQQRLAETYSWIILAGEIYDQPLFDQVHLTDAGYLVVAERNANAILNSKGYTVSGSVNGPTLASAIRTTSTNVDVTIAHDAGTDFTPTTGIEGFTYFDGSSTIDITAAIRVDATTIRLTLDSEPSGTEVEQLYYMYDAELTLDITKIVKDNSATALPIRPGVVEVNV